MASAQNESPLLRMPREIRDAIYEDVFTSSESGTQHCVNIEEAGPGILLACKQTLHEAIDIYYSKTRFQFETAGRGVHWFKHLSDRSRSKITDVCWSSSEHTWCAEALLEHYETLEEGERAMIKISRNRVQSPLGAFAQRMDEVLWLDFHIVKVCSC